MRFLREYWAWIVVPALVVLAALAASILLSGGDDAVSPFLYDL